MATNSVVVFRSKTRSARGLLGSLQAKSANAEYCLWYIAYSLSAVTTFVRYTGRTDTGCVLEVNGMRAGPGLVSAYRRM